MPHTSTSFYTNIILHERLMTVLLNLTNFPGVSNLQIRCNGRFLEQSTHRAISFSRWFDKQVFSRYMYKYLEPVTEGCDPLRPSTEWHFALAGFYVGLKSVGVRFPNSVYRLLLKSPNGATFSAGGSINKFLTTIWNQLWKAVNCELRNALPPSTECNGNIVRHFDLESGSMYLAQQRRSLRK